MAGTDLIVVTKQYVDPVTSVNTNGVEERITLTQFMGLLPAGTGNGTPTQVIQTTAPAAAPVPFADLTAAANSFNALRTALITAKVLV